MFTTEAEIAMGIPKGDIPKPRERGPPFPLALMGVMGVIEGSSDFTSPPERGLAGWVGR